MQNLNSIFEKSYELDRHVPGLYGLLLILQEAAGDHASKLGFGYESLREKGFFWALIRQKLVMDIWPKGEEPITIKTWSLPIQRMQAIREFELYDGHKRIGACSTTWVILDSQTRRPKTIEDSEDLFKPRKDYSVGFAAGKLNTPDAMILLKPHAVDPSDLDSNNHVNNTNYARWILEAISASEWHEIREYEINFLAEALLGDQIELLGNTDRGNLGEMFFKGHRIRDDKSIFTARMVV
ncbi:MAG: thioesterase [Cyclobacteriaceae bacterium]